MGVMLLLASTNPACVKCELCTKLKAGLAWEQHGLCPLVGELGLNSFMQPKTLPITSMEVYRDILGGLSNICDLLFILKVTST